MGKPHPVELRTRIVAFVNEGHGHREAARHFRVSPRCVNDLMKLWRATRSVEPRRQGNGGGHGKLVGVQDWIAARIAVKPDLTLDEIAAELADTHGITVHPVTVSRTLHGLGLSHKKSPPSRRAKAAGCARCAPPLDRTAPAIHGQSFGKAELCRRDLAQDQPSKDHRLGAER